MPIIKTLEKLLELPLFQGMSRNDLNDVISHAEFKFRKYTKNKIIAKDGEACTHIHLLMNGKVAAEGHADNNRYVITEELNAPEIIQPERIFGLTQRYTKTFITLTECEFACIDKYETMKLFEEYEIFRLNMLNMICTQTQKMTRIPWRNRPKNIYHKIVRFIESHCIRPAGYKTITIKMEELAKEIGESRLNVSAELNAMHADGLIILRRGEFIVPALERLLNTDRQEQAQDMCLKEHEH